MTSTQLQNTLPAANMVKKVNTSTMDTPANPISGEDDENSIQDIMANVNYYTHEWLGDKHVIYKVGNPDVKAEYKILVQNNPSTVLFDSEASVPLISEEFYKHFSYAVKLLKHDDTIIVTASGSNLGPVGQCYLTFKLGKKTFTDKIYILWNLEWGVILGLRWIKNYCIVFYWNISGQHYLQCNMEYQCTSLPQSKTSSIVCYASTVCITPKSVAIIPVKVSVVLNKKKLCHLVGNDSVPEGLISWDVSHRVNHKHPKNFLIPVLNSKME